MTTPFARLSSFAITLLIALGIVLLSWAISQLPQEATNMIRLVNGFTIVALLVWVIRHVLAYDGRLERHREEIVEALNHRLEDLKNLKVTAETLESRTEAIADRLEQKTRIIASEVAEAAKDATDKAAVESQKRHERLDDRLGEVIKRQKELLANGHDAKPILKDTNDVVHDVADAILDTEKGR